MKKIGIITFHNGSNYGAALQTYALQEAVKRANADVCIINYKNRLISKGLDKVRIEFSLRGIYNALFDLIHFSKNQIKIERFKSFFKEYYYLSEPMDSYELHTVGLDLDIGLSGSDQIWNPILNGGVDDIYFLNFPGVKSKHSYASSFGSYKFNNDEYNQTISNLLASYLNVSVRENGDLLQKFTNKAINNVCDPTLLLSKNEWKEGLKLSKLKEKYLLIYAMTDFHNISEYAKEIALQRGLKIKYIGMPIKRKKEIEYIVDAGPKEFVELFYNADYIVTNSFHGTAFSVNFKKQFVSLKNPKNPERASYFLNSIDFGERLVENSNIMLDDISSERYLKVDEMLNIFIRESIKYLTSIIE